MKEKRIVDILSKLTLKQKTSLCSGSSFWLTQPIEEHGIPAVWVSDGPHGMRKEVSSGGTNIMQKSEPATCFPPAVTTASSWDIELARAAGDAIAKEAKASKVCTVLGPGINIKRSPLCGRNFEYFSEDPYQAAQMGAAWVNGVQQNKVGTSLKHFLANNQETIRLSIDTIVDERALREIYLPAFEHIVKTEQPTTVMCSYNKVNGCYLSDSKLFLTDVLRDEWGFKGIVVSDWGAVNNRVDGVKAGLDLEMPTTHGMNDAFIEKAVLDGSLKEEELDVVCYRMIKFALDSKANEVDDYTVDFDKHHNLAREIAENSAVLLKNDNATLPLTSGKSIAVIGGLAKKLRYQGSGSSFINTTKVVSFYDAMVQNNQTFEYAKGYTFKKDGYSSKLIREAMKTAKDKDIVLVFIGLTDLYESEGYDRSHINLPDAHNILVEKLLEVNKNIVVVLSCGSPVKVKAWDKQVKSILNMYLTGQAGGEACYNLLFGKVNPSGKLAETFPFRNHHNVVARYFPMGPHNVQYRESIYVGYRFYDKANIGVQYPFGYGLSYTKFEYSKLELSSKKIKESDKFELSFEIKNTGSLDGSEIAQVYVSDQETTIFRPIKELKGFKKVFLKAGESTTVTISLDSRSFSYYNVLIKDWHIESGNFDILIGSSSIDIKLQDTVWVDSLNPDAPIPDYKKDAPYYYNLDDKDVSLGAIPCEQFKFLYGGDFIKNVPFTKGTITTNSPISSIGVSPWGKFIAKMVMLGAKIIASSAENKEMITGTAGFMPLRAATTFSGGFISFYSLNGIVDMINGKRGGLRKFLRGMRKKYKYEV